MRLDATDLRYVSADEFRVLTAAEIGSKNHEVVPTSLIAEISGIRGGNVNKCLGSLAKRGLVARVQNIRYDGYRLTYGGLDYLALRTFSRRKPASVGSVGKKIGVGKESDIYIVKDDTGEQRILKLQRLGRISFRTIKSKRDYLGKRQSASWQYMSRLAAQKEFAFMKVLYQNDFPVPVPIDQARHCIVMSLIDSYPLRQVDHVESPSDLYATLMEIIMRLARCGLIHGDFNEFNILIRRKDGEPVIIDFPQMVSTRHENAEYFFNRDVNCIRKFFRKRYRYEAATWPTWKDVLEEEAEADAVAREQEPREEGASEPSADQTGPETAESSTTPAKRLRLDLEVEASGFGRALQRELEDYMIEVQDLPDTDGEEDEEDEEQEDEEEDEEEPEPEPEQPAPEPFDEEAFQKQMSDRLEAIRLNKALGNDDDDADSHSDSSQSDSDSDDVLSDAPPQSDFTAYVRAPPVRPPRIDARKLGSGNELRDTVARQAVRQSQEKDKKHHSKKGAKAGNAKGHKWKTNASHIVAKAGGDGW